MVSICLTRRVGALARLHGRETKYFSRNRSTKTKKAMPIQATTFHDFSGKTLGGGTTVRDFVQLNALAEKYGDDLVILGFPCNQFGHQCYEKDFELLNTLKYVRPGDGYAPKFQLMTKSVVNGDEQEASWTFLKDSIPYPCDDRGGTGSDFIYKTQPNDKPIQWSPVRRNDVSWNFEKFLIDKEGVPFKRYSPKFENKDMVPDIETLLMR
ncbi:unnamed protein product [Bathycoccus prasinos]